MRTGRDDKKRAEWFQRPGEWNSEPDWAVLEEESMSCTVRRNGSGAWCGYVIIPDWHPFYGNTKVMHGEPVWLDVHGGVSFNGMMGFNPETGIDPSWVVGFDCSHMSDLSPGDPRSAGTYHNFEYAETETRGLAAQVSQHGSLEQLCRIVSGSNNGGEE